MSWTEFGGRVSPDPEIKFLTKALYEFFKAERRDSNTGTIPNLRIGFAARKN